MASTIPHNKFIFIMTSDPPILSLNFFMGYFYSKLSIFGKKCMLNAMGKILKVTMCIFDIIFWFLHIHPRKSSFLKIKSDTLSFTHFVHQT